MSRPSPTAVGDTLLLAVADIVVGERLRLVDDKHVARLAASMKKTGGELSAILVHEKDGDYHLAAGAHRLQAARLLGRPHIRARVLPDEDAAKLAEIEENLFRKGLTVLEEAEHIVERDRLVARHPPHRSKGETVAHFEKTQETAQELGMSRRSVEIRRTIGRLPREVRDGLRGTPWENRTRALRDVANIGHVEGQLAATRVLASGRKGRASDVLEQAKKAAGVEVPSTPTSPPVATSPSTTPTSVEEFTASLMALLATTDDWSVEDRREAHERAFGALAGRLRRRAAPDGLADRQAEQMWEVHRWLLGAERKVGPEHWDAWLHEVVDAATRLIDNPLPELPPGVDIHDEAARDYILAWHGLVRDGFVRAAPLLRLPVWTAATEESDARATPKQWDMRGLWDTRDVKTTGKKRQSRNRTHHVEADRSSYHLPEAWTYERAMRAPDGWTDPKRRDLRVPRPRAGTAGTARVVSICSGVGLMDLGLAVGLAASGMVAEFDAMVEMDPFCRDILGLRFPGVDLATTTLSPPTDEDPDNYARLRGYADCDVLIGGYPCKPFSGAGDRQGEDHKQYLVDEVFRLVAGLRPKVCLFENVRDFHTGTSIVVTLPDGTDKVMPKKAANEAIKAGDAVSKRDVKGYYSTIFMRRMASLGYDMAWARAFSGYAFGQDHHRDRWFCIAWRARGWTPLSPYDRLPPELQPPPSGPAIWATEAEVAQPALHDDMTRGEKRLARARVGALGNGVVVSAAVFYARYVAALLQNGGMTDRQVRWLAGEKVEATRKGHGVYVATDPLELLAGRVENVEFLGMDPDQADPWAAENALRQQALGLDDLGIHEPESMAERFPEVEVFTGESDA